MASIKHVRLLTRRYAPVQIKDHRSPLGSVYALDISGDAKIVAVGSPEGHLRITDARQPEKSYKLRGHTDNIR